MIQRKIFILTAVLGVLTAGVCFGEDLSAKELVSRELLEHGGFEMNWQVKLPIKEGEKLGRMFVFDKFLYVLTDKNYLFCIERTSGAGRFELPLAKAGLWIFEPQYYDGKLWFMVGNHLLVVDPKAGAVISSRFLPSCFSGPQTPRRWRNHAVRSSLSERHRPSAAPAACRAPDTSRANPLRDSIPRYSRNSSSARPPPGSRPAEK